MKKRYTAPEILFEDFSISTNIAAGCEEKSNLPSYNSCGLKWGKKTLFTDELAVCTTKFSAVEDSPFDGLCYHNPNSDYNLFNS